MLIDGLCAIYDDRPLICRSHGLPLWSREDEQVFHCALNFRDGQPDRRSVLDLEALNRPLAAMAELYDPSGSRTPLTELARDLETTGTSAK
jgi:Fe-S-cluster containining protein